MKKFEESSTNWRLCRCTCKQDLKFSNRCQGGVQLDNGGPWTVKGAITINEWVSQILEGYRVAHTSKILCHIREKYPGMPHSTYPTLESKNPWGKLRWKPVSYTIIRSYTDTLSFQAISCTNCGATFANKQSLERHLRNGVCTSTPQPPSSVPSTPSAFECDNCNRTFTLKHSLIRHIAKNVCGMNGRQSYQCNVCTKRFPTIELLSMHSRKHESKFRLP